MVYNESAHENNLEKLFITKKKKKKKKGKLWYINMYMYKQKLKYRNDCKAMCFKVFNHIPAHCL